jgi:hypothetical protein
MVRRQRLQGHCGHENENHSLLCHKCGNDPRPKPFSMRGIRFLVGGLAGGTALVAVISLVFDDRSYLTRWLSGLAAVAIALICVSGKKWFMGRAIRLAQRSAEPDSRTGEPDA